MSDRLPAADVVVVGAGAAGSVAAHVLTEAGLDVVVLEAGSRVDFSMWTLDELYNDVRGWLSDPKSRAEIPTWRVGATADAVESPYPMLMVNAVGGSAVHYEGASLRFLPWNFTSRSSTIARYGAGVIPEHSTVADWPFDYGELEPYYEQVELAIGVSGKAGGNHFEGPRRSEYPMPPLRPSGWTELMTSGAEGIGWHPYPVPAAINSEPYGGRPACTYCGYCRHNGCYVGAKGSPDVALLPAAEATGLLRIETEARALRIEVDAEGLASGVTYVQGGRERFQPAHAILLGAFLYENTRLLLLSNSPAFPDGLANNHGQVGKHYMAHVTPFAFGLFPGRRLNRWNGSGGQIVCVDDWNGDNFDHQEVDFVGGASLMAMNEVKPIGAASDPLPPGVPRWGSRWKAWLKANAQSIGSGFAQFENLSYEGNELDLDSVKRDAIGLPVMRVTHRIGENERRGWDFMRERLCEWFVAAGATETWSSTAMLLDGRHPCGGTRMGDDPDASVVDGFCFAHEVPNLGVLGASVFPTTGGHNPTLTVQAVAWRTARHLIDDWGAHSNKGVNT